MTTIHVIPVPSMLTAEEAFDEIDEQGQLLPEHVEHRPQWAAVKVHDDGTKELLTV